MERHFKRGTKHVILTHNLESRGPLFAVVFIIKMAPVCVIKLEVNKTTMTIKCVLSILYSKPWFAQKLKSQPFEQI